MCGVWSGIEFDLAVKLLLDPGPKDTTLQRRIWNVEFGKTFCFAYIKVFLYGQKYDDKYGPCPSILVL